MDIVIESVHSTGNLLGWRVQADATAEDKLACKLHCRDLFRHVGAVAETVPTQQLQQKKKSTGLRPSALLCAHPRDINS